MYSLNLINKVRLLRKSGKTYREIREAIRLQIPKSTLSEWCKNIQLTSDHLDRISRLNLNNLKKARLIALDINKIKRREFLEKIERDNIQVAERIHHPEIAKIALAMLCLGEASKSKRKTSFYFGNSDPMIIQLFLKLLKGCFDFKLDKIRCTVQCRSDQNILALEKFWVGITKIPKNLFYKARIDPRTIGKPTTNKEYRGVLRIDYFDNKVRLELEVIADLVYNQLLKAGS